MELGGLGPPRPAVPSHTAQQGHTSCIPLSPLSEYLTGRIDTPTPSFPFRLHAPRIRRASQGCRPKHRFGCHSAKKIPPRDSVLPLRPSPAGPGLAGGQAVYRGMRIPLLSDSVPCPRPAPPRSEASSGLWSFSPSAVRPHFLGDDGRTVPLDPVAPRSRGGPGRPHREPARASASPGGQPSLTFL